MGYVVGRLVRKLRSASRGLEDMVVGWESASGKLWREGGARRPLPVGNTFWIFRLDESLTILGQSTFLLGVSVSRFGFRLFLEDMVRGGRKVSEIKGGSGSGRGGGI